MARKTAETVNPGGDLRAADAGRLDETLARRDASLDGWTTEVLNDKAAAKLDVLGQWFSTPDSIPVEAGAEVLSPTLDFNMLPPNNLNPSFEGREMTVWRPTGDLKSDNLKTVSAEQFIESFRQFAGVFGGDEHVHYKFKIIRVADSGDSVETTAYFQADSNAGNESLQVNATWDCTWTRGETGLRLSGIKVRDYNEVRGTFAGGHLFADCTESVLKENKSYEGQILKSTNYWRHIAGFAGCGFVRPPGAGDRRRQWRWA